MNILTGRHAIVEEICLVVERGQFDDEHDIEMIRT